ncbi:hypothetical protein AC578_10755 [Pseudocercospora eumusae]|uniref:RTA1 domain protein n=1 Tax=Pseudocercospora eumusae TaxID=321146 RepID=A0A139GZT3_9PEZI|nr:hypothetical protein AC578_10755 [Pseudocercospora eumusae]
MSNPFENCTEVTPSCPVEATTYGYYPNLAGNSLLLSIFALCTISQLLLALRFRILAFSTIVSLASLSETIGYTGRILMHKNPWSDTAFKIQIVCLILAPSFLAAGIYLTLKHIVMALGPDKSRLQPNLYPKIFITCDAVSIVMQAIGGGVASAGQGKRVINIGNSIMISGIAVQVATMGLCLFLALDFAVALGRSRRLRSEALGRYVSTSMKAFRMYLGAFCLAFVMIFVRCIYRLPEMAGGWGNALMRNEKEFLVLDGAMIAIATVLMTVAHPGIFFPAMRNKTDKKGEVKDSELSTPEEMSERD